MKVLIVSSSLGAGHDGVAQEMAARLLQAGHEVNTIDYLHTLPLRIGSAAKSAYEAQVRYAPWTAEQTFRTYGAIWVPFARITGNMCARRVLDAIESTQCDLVVTNNPHATMSIGHLVGENRIPVPVVTYVTDFGINPLWIHEDIHTMFLVHESSIPAAVALGAQRTSVVGPLVRPQFGSNRRDDAVRHELGLNNEDISVLVTAGAWGVGTLLHTVSELTSMPGVRPVVVCGQDERLRRQLSVSGKATVLGWVEDMASLMANVDVLVENAGGLTSLEGIQSGLPVISYRPLAGHGRLNVEAMAVAGVSHYARTVQELELALHAAVEGRMAKPQLPTSNFVDQLEFIVDSSYAEMGRTPA